ncbi:MAG: IS3 family transposase [Bacteroidota bacterium]
MAKTDWCSFTGQSRTKRSVENPKLVEQIVEIHNHSYGSPRITIERKARGFQCSRPRVARLMRHAQIRSRVASKFVVTTHSDHDFEFSPTLLAHDFSTGQLSRAWVSDITSIATAKGWLYLTVVIDLGDRRVIGWSMSSGMKASQTVYPALKMALKNRAPRLGTIFHSDRGIQYSGEEFRKMLAQNPELKQSMSRKGDCWDNAVAESFFKTLKVENIYGRKFEDRNQAKNSIFEYIEFWYNRFKMHQKSVISPYSHENSFSPASMATARVFSSGGMGQA